MINIERPPVGMGPTGGHDDGHPSGLRASKALDNRRVGWRICSITDLLKTKSKLLGGNGKGSCSKLAAFTVAATESCGGLGRQVNSGTSNPTGQRLPDGRRGHSQGQGDAPAFYRHSSGATWPIGKDRTPGGALRTISYFQISGLLED